VIQELPKIQWSDDDFASFGKIPQVSQHPFSDLAMFDDDRLAELLDRHPREGVLAHTMGTDPTKNNDWQPVNIPRELTGVEILQAVRKAKIWINVVHLEENHPEYVALIESIYERLEERCTHLKDLEYAHSSLLISSPAAQVYYHLDAKPNMIWHMRGQKRIWIYPAWNLDIAPQEMLEDIYAGEIDEDLPYKPEFDELAECYLLNPGDMAAWPQNAPHRVENVDMNVSLSTSYATPLVRKRQLVQLANRFILRRLGITNRGMSETGIVAALKRFTFQVVNRLRPFEPTVRVSYATNLELDPQAENGIRVLKSRGLTVGKTDRRRVGSRRSGHKEARVEVLASRFPIPQLDYT